MKKIIIAFLSFVAISFATEIQVLEPTGADFSPDAPKMVHSIVRAAVVSTGNTPVESSAENQLRINLMMMGTSIIVVCEQVKQGSVIGSSKQKASSLDELDVAIDKAVQIALANVSTVDNSDAKAYAPQGTYQESTQQVIYIAPQEKKENPNDNFAYKRPTRNYASYGLGVAGWHNWGYYNEYEYYNGHSYEYISGPDEWKWDIAFVFHYARIFETTPHSAITIVNNVNASINDYFQLHETFLVGGRYLFSTGEITPYLGSGIGIGVQLDAAYNNDGIAVGIAADIEFGVIFFRNSAAQLELGFVWDAIWDGFEAFDQRFGAGSFYVAINY